MSGLFITFEGTECSGKTTQIAMLADRLQRLGIPVVVVREPGGTPLGEEIRHTLKHSQANHAMTPETELLLLNASRAQLVREVIRPALAAGRVVISDRFYDSSLAYQGFGRGIDLETVRWIINFAVGDTTPDITFLLMVPLEVSYQRRAARQATLPIIRDRIEEADKSFFERVAEGYKKLAEAEPHRIKLIDATADAASIARTVWEILKPILQSKGYLHTPGQATA